MLGHWVADFVFQPEEWALAKSTDTKVLAKHVVLTASLTTLFAAALLPLSLLGVLTFALLTFTTHFMIDYVTSVFVGRRFKGKYLGGPIPNMGAFSLIGFDQWLHQMQLILTCYLVLRL